MDVVLEFFTGQEWPVALSDEDGLETAFEGTTSAWPCRAYVFENDARLVFVSVFPEVVPEAARPAIGELCNRANFGLAIGNFELDFDGGEVRFRTAADGDGTTLDTEHVSNVVVANVMTMDRYLPAIVAVLQGADPADAVEDVEEG